MNPMELLWPPVKARLQWSGSVLWRALVKYDETDGEQRAASFAYYAFFALFPLIVLLIVIGTTFLGDQELAARKITDQVQLYLFMDSDSTAAIIKTIDGVLQSRKSAGLIAFVILAWSALRFFQSLVHGVNRAWGTKEYSWWRMPIKNLLMVIILTSALLIGIVVPTVLDQIQALYIDGTRRIGFDIPVMIEIFALVRLLVQPLVLFYGFSMFYKFAPRRRTMFREVWMAALFVTLGLHLLQQLFILYTSNITNFNAIYGTFGSVVAMLLWIYLSGAIIILGGCLCAARYEINLKIADQAESSRAG